MGKDSNTILGILAGTAIGATLGILFAPDKGVNTRQKIADEAINTKDMLAEKATVLKDNVVTTMSGKKETLDSQLENIVSDASHKADDLISSLEKKLAQLKAKNKKLQKTS
ncbi:MAG: YtxH domain-containing protein [Algicola sp.]|nr:YtxH domain-containing protein [Algicola sp.]